MPEASIGRIVHYALENRGCRAAQITALFDQGSGPPLLNLVVTLDGRNDTDHRHEHRMPAPGDGAAAGGETYGGPIDLHRWETSVPYAEPFQDPNVRPHLVPNTWHWPERTA